MSDEVSSGTDRGTSGNGSELDRRILSFIQKEIQDKTAVLTRATRRDEVSIDSIDVVNVVFAIEEEFDVEVNLSSDMRFDTVGDLLDALIAFIPADKRQPR